MIDVVLFHHVLGLTPGVVALADSLRAAGHVVDTPDLFDGRRFETIEAGAAHAEEVGFGTILERGAAVVDGRAGFVVAGISLGVLPAQMLAQTRSDEVAGAVLIEACVPPSEFGDRWASSMPVQIHGMESDPFFAGEGDIDAAREIVQSRERASLFVYPGDRHLFTDESLPSHDAGATALLLERVISFLADLR